MRKDEVLTVALLITCWNANQIQVLGTSVGDVRLANAEKSVTESNVGWERSTGEEVVPSGLFRSFKR